MDFDESFENITAMRSLEGEVVPLRNTVRISDTVEVRLLSYKLALGSGGAPFPSMCLSVGQVWLNSLSTEMKATLKHLLCECVAAGKRGEVDPARYPSQVMLRIFRYLFTFSSQWKLLAAAHFKSCAVFWCYCQIKFTYMYIYMAKPTHRQVSRVVGSSL